MAQSLADDAVNAYVYGYPLVLMRALAQAGTNVAAPDELHNKAPVNQFARQSHPAGPDFRTVIMPGVDTLYASAWLDLAEPVVLHVPDTHGRYYLAPVVSAWTNVVESPGKRTTGTGAQDFAVTGPGWTGALPPGVRRIASPTRLAWILARLEYTGRADLMPAREVMAGFTLTPLSAYGTRFVPPRGPVDPRLPSGSPYARVAGMDAQSFFAAVAAELAHNPPAPQDAEMVRTLERLGIVGGAPFALAAKGPEVARALARAARTGPAKIRAAPVGGQLRNGWRYDLAAGRYGANYLYRAAMAMHATGANLPKDNLYYFSIADDAGASLTGSRRYLLRFPRDRTPPVDAFWSATVYDESGFLTPNPIDRYTIGNYPKPVANSDGSVDILLQNAPPEDGKPNWLPTPTGPFTVVLRLYSPRPEALDGAWSGPPRLHQTG
ncbi:MAG: DUF1254 domain-containing protein [Streptomycetaceae bacterium]|nr:DUF1254 domain-containing protein [Streptomycetaceae bacterium]